MSEELKPVLKLSGEDGNAFIIIGRATRAARQAGWSQERIKQMRDRLSAGDYMELLQAAMEMFEVE